MPGPEVTRACKNVLVCDGSGGLSILEARLAQAGLEERAKGTRPALMPLLEVNHILTLASVTL